jgi:hypothetical protein
MKTEGWVELTRFTGAGGDLAANMLMARLESEQIPARRFPLQTPATLIAGVIDQPIFIMVPDEYESAAREMLEAAPQQPPWDDMTSDDGQEPSDEA